jgi:hypothetical protein
MKFAKFILAAALTLPFFAKAQESLPPDLSAPPAPPSMNEPGLEPMPSDGAIIQHTAPALELGETKKVTKKKAKKGKNKKHHPTY